jgi:hypothetical protein
VVTQALHGLLMAYQALRARLEQKARLVLHVLGTYFTLQYIPTVFGTKNEQ